MEDYARLHPEQAGTELGDATRKLAEIREVVTATIYTTPSEALKAVAKILRIIDTPGQPQ